MSTALEHLADAERLAFALKADGRAPDDPASLVSALPILTHQAREAWDAIVKGTRSDDRTAIRLDVAAKAMQWDEGRHIWPADVQPDSSLLRIAGALKAAAQARASEADTAPDPKAARRMIVSTLWIASHHVATATRGHIRGVLFDQALTVASQRRIADRARASYERLDAIEHLAAAALAEHRHTAPASTGQGIGAAFASWDLQAHRALVLDHSTTAVMMVAHHQWQIGAAVGQAIGSAAGTLDGPTRDRIRPAIGDTTRAWRVLRNAAEPLAFSTISPPRPFLDQARRLNQFLSTANATPADSLDTLGLAPHYLASSVSTAATISDIACQGELRAPARAVARVLAERESKVEQVSIDVKALSRRESLVLPDFARPVLGEPAEHCVKIGHQAQQVCGDLDHATLMTLASIESDPPRPATLLKPHPIEAREFTGRNTLR